MSDDNFTKLAVEKYMVKFEEWERRRTSSKIGRTFSTISGKSAEDKYLKFKFAFEHINTMPVELWVENIFSFFSFVSLFLERFEMTAKEKRCIIFYLVEKGIEKEILNTSSMVVSDIVRIQHSAIYKSYFCRIENGKKIDIYDLCDLRTALMNLHIDKGVVDDITNDIKSDLNIYSGLEEYDGIELSTSMKKLKDKVFEYSNRFVQEDIDGIIFDKVFKYRKNGIRNNLSFLKQVIFSESIFGDLKILSDILVLFRTEFDLKQVDFMNIIFEVVENNIKLGILNEDALFFSRYDIPDTVWENIDGDVINKILEDPAICENVLKNSNFIKEMYSLLIESCLNKKQSDGSFKDLSLSDLENVKKALKELGANSFVIDNIIKRLKCEVKQVDSPIIRRVDKESLSNVEYKECLRKLKTYIQFDERLPSDEMIINSMEILKKVTVKDKRICVSLMEKLGLSDKVILSFLEKVERVNLFSMDIKTIIASYEMEVKNWLNVYREYDEYRERINNIEEVYKEACSCYINYYKNKDSSSHKECEEWCKILKDEIEDFYLVIDSAQKRNVSLLKKIRRDN